MAPQFCLQEHLFIHAYVGNLISLLLCRVRKIKVFLLKKLFLQKNYFCLVQLQVSIPSSTEIERRLSKRLISQHIQEVLSSQITGQSSYNCTYLAWWIPCEFHLGCINRKVDIITGSSRYCW